ncbi:MAG: hypothetical protein WC271_01325 [Bacteroidales bacterium]|nr:hypothetical protein [Bacteroidales bacterium]NLO49916.1 hypothetical protein [Bacteroidales bacterium]
MFYYIKKYLIMNAKPLIMLVMIFSFVATSQAFSQSDEPPAKVYGGIGYFQAGYSFMDFNDLNNAFVQAGIPEINNGSVSLGGGGHYIFRRFLIGGEGNGLIGSRTANENFSVRHSGGMGFFNAGYIVLQRPLYTVYPILGIGGGGYSVTIIDRNAATASLQEVLDNPHQQAELSKGSFMLNFSVGADLFVFADRTQQGTGGFVVGVRAGYLLAFDTDEWRLDDYSFTDGTNTSISGPFIRLIIGGGGLLY